MKIKFKKLHEKAVLPTYGTDYSAGMDLYPTEGPTIKDGFIQYKFGFAIEIPEGYAGFIFPRSSISKTDLNLCNAVGIIDADYRGEVMARFNLNMPIGVDMVKFIDDMIYVNNYSDDDDVDAVKNLKGFTKFKDGDAILQIVIMPVPKIESMWVDELSDTVRGDGGFGHTNK